MILSRLLNEYEHWFRCIIAINYHIRNALLDILHDQYNGLPRNPNDLYEKLDKDYCKLKKLKAKKILSEDEINFLMPSSRESNSQDWDITVIVVMIRNFYKGLKPPNGTDGWKTKKPEHDDFSLAATLVRAREIRNLFLHNVMDKFKPLSEFETQMDAVRVVLVGLQYKNMDDFDADDLLYMIDLADIRKSIQLGLNSTYECEKCGLQLDESKFKDVIDNITEELKKKEKEGNNIIVFTQCGEAVLTTNLMSNLASIWLRFVQF